MPNWILIDTEFPGQAQTFENREAGLDAIIQLMVDKGADKKIAGEIVTRTSLRDNDEHAFVDPDEGTFYLYDWNLYLHLHETQGKNVWLAFDSGMRSTFTSDEKVQSDSGPAIKFTINDDGTVSHEDDEWTDEDEEN